VVLDRQNALVLYDSPSLMHEGDWTVGLILDAAADAAQREALERILAGAVGGPWAVLARFVTRRLPTRVAAFHFEEAGRIKRVRAEGVLEAAIEGVASKRTGETAMPGNLFNVIHSAIQYLARGSSTVTTGPGARTTRDRHALYSEFAWAGP
jgi:hypothetical protein